jgi:hypothetical protein
MPKQISVIMPENTYNVLNRERRNISMSSFVADLLGLYAEVIESDKATTGETAN